MGLPAAWLAGKSRKNKYFWKKIEKKVVF